MVRQLANESDGIRDERLRVLAQRHFTRERIERGEQSVFDEDVLRTRQHAKDRRLAGVRVADERRAELAAPRAPLHGSSLLELAQLLAQQFDAIVDEAAVRLELRFTGTAHADAAAEFLEVRPHAGQPW